MKRLREWESSGGFRGGWLSIGNFDGVHIGHRAILDELRTRAQQDSVPSVVLTFEPHPLLLLNPERYPPRLTTADQRAEQLAAAGIDVLVEYPTDRTFLNLTAEEFFTQIVEQEIDARGLVEGPNFYYGRGRAGSVRTLQLDCRRTGRELVVMPPAVISGEMVSSSRIRQAIATGDVRIANRMLGRPYSVAGIVAEGVRRGRTIGFPTANLHETHTLLPADGVYAGRVRLNGQQYLAAIHIGPNPTFAEGERKLEVHLLDFTGDLYGRKLEVCFERQIRSLTKFASVDELKSQIARDVESVRTGSRDA